MRSHNFIVKTLSIKRVSTVCYSSFLLEKHSLALTDGGLEVLHRNMVTYLDNLMYLQHLKKGNDLQSVI